LCYGELEESGCLCLGESRIQRGIRGPKVGSSNLTPATNQRSFGPEPRIPALLFLGPEECQANPRPTYRKAERGAPVGLFVFGASMSRLSGKPYFVYVLWPASASRFYIGISEDPDVRLAQHNAGVSKWTSNYDSWELVLVERYANYSEARKRELLLKKQKGGTCFYALTGLDPTRFRKRPAPSAASLGSSLPSPGRLNATKSTR